MSGEWALLTMTWDCPTLYILYILHIIYYILYIVLKAYAPIFQLR